MLTNIGNACLGAPNTTNQHEYLNFLYYVMQPLTEGLLSYVTVLIGLCLLYIAIHRMRHHGSGMQTGKHHSGMATGFYFLAAMVMLEYQFFVSVLSQTIFQNGFDSSMTTIGYFCTQIGSATDINTQTKYFIFAVLMAVGLLSFIRGFIILIKLGEGQTESPLPKALTHIVAGIIAVNGQAVYSLAQNIIDLVSGSSS